MLYTLAFLVGMLHIFNVEGGYAVLGDGAGATKYGITQRTYPHEKIRSLTRRRAGTLYHRDFWSPIRADEMSCVMSLTVFDSAVNTGKIRAIKLLQRTYELPESGVVTSALLHKMALSEERFFIYNEHRKQAYRTFRGYRRFGKHWLKRIPRQSQCEQKLTEKDVF